MVGIDLLQKKLIRWNLRSKSNQISGKNLLPLTGKTPATLRRYCIYLSLLSLVSLFVLSQCANSVSPSGGPKDTTPPTVTGCTPPNYSVHFKGKTIHIEFDEFINAETAGDKILVSPPPSESPDYRVRGKGIVITFADTLRPDRTYSIDFSTSISDITEGNKLTGFKYAFSTGSVLDSLTVTGKVTDAFTTDPVKDILVMLYTTDNDTVPPDSLPVLIRPLYLTRTAEDGSFTLSNLASGSYKVFALSDKSGDMLFNLKGEQIAFMDSLVSPWYAGPAVHDTAARDSVTTDTLTLHANPPHALDLKLFTPTDSAQSLDKSVLVRDRMINLVFLYPPRNLRIVPLTSDSLSDWCLQDPGITGDTITLWLTGNLTDSVRLKISADRMQNDTIDLPVHVYETNKKGKKEVAEKPRPLEVRANNQGGILNHFVSPLILTASYPLKKYDLSEIRLIDGKDTIRPAAAIFDSIHRRIVVRHKWGEARPYQLFVPDSAFLSVNGLANDTVRIRFRTADPRNYGNIKLNISVPDGIPQVIVQLLTSNDKIAEEKIINKTGRVSFDYLLPAKYKLKVILDNNLNRQWDSGDYFRKVQPEKVICFPRILDLRANWDIEETWKL
jgi:hypothetical protein